MAPFKNLIFDIGNVIIDIDYAVPIREFQKLSTVNFSEIVNYSKQHEVFNRFEKGEISVKEFHDVLRQFFKKDVSDEEILKAWNSILIHYPAEKFELLNTLKKSYRVLALSNINETHVNAINAAAVEQLEVKAFSDFFHKAYYSNEIGMRKPDLEIYEFVLQQENLNASETFFVDDKIENVEAAKQVGLQAFQLEQPQHLFELLTRLQII